GGAAVVGGAGLRERVVGVEGIEGFYLILNRLRARDDGLGEFDRSDGLRFKKRGEFGKGAEMKRNVGHGQKNKGSVIRTGGSRRQQRCQPRPHAAKSANATGSAKY